MTDLLLQYFIVTMKQILVLVLAKWNKPQSESNLIILCDVMTNQTLKITNLKINMV